MKPGIILSAMLVTGLIACDRIAHVPANPTSSQASAPMSATSQSLANSSLNPGNMWDRLELDERDLAKTYPGMFTRVGKTLTIARQGKPFAEFKDTYAGEDSATWRFLGPVTLFDDRSKTPLQGFRLERGADELSEEVLLDPDGSLHKMGEDAKVSPNGKFIANGNLNDMTLQKFAVMDWPARTVATFEATCVTLAWQDSDHATLLCQSGDVKVGDYKAELTHGKDGHWQLTSLGRLAQEVKYDSHYDVLPDSVVVIASHDKAKPLTATVKPLKDDTAFFLSLGYRRLP